MLLSFLADLAYQLCQKLCQPFPQPPLCQPPLPQLCQPPFPQPPLRQPPPLPQPPFRQPTPPPTFNHSASITVGPDFASLVASMSETALRISASRSATWVGARPPASGAGSGLTCVAASADEIPNTPVGSNIASTFEIRLFALIAPP